MNGFPRHRLRVPRAACAAALLAALALPLLGVLRAADIARITLLQERGGRVDWSADGALIAFDRVDAGGHYAVFTMRPDGKRIVWMSTAGGWG